MPHKLLYLIVFSLAVADLRVSAQNADWHVEFSGCKIASNLYYVGTADRAKPFILVIGSKTNYGFSLMKGRVDNERALRRIMIWGSSLAAGFATASMQALQPELSFRISINTVVAFAVGAAMLAVCWRIILNPSLERGQKVRRLTVSAMLALAGLAGLLYPLRFVAPDKLRPLCIGIAMAVCALSGVATLLLMCKRIFDADEQNNAGEPGNNR